MQLTQVDPTNVPQAKDVRTRIRSGFAQLEILMWKGVVSFLRWKPGARLTIPILALGLALFLLPAGIGIFQLGRQLVPGKVIESIPYQSPQEAQNTNLGQHNLLLVLVNNLQQPKLEGVWLVVNGNLNNGSKFLPVEFPAEVQTSGAMLIEDGGAPARKFVDELIRRGLWWDYYLVLDEAGLAALTGWSVTSGFSGDPGSSGEERGTPTSKDLEEGQGIYQQAASLRALCERSALINQALDPETVLVLLKGHFRTDYDLSRLAEEWYSFRHRGFAWYCEFPTINEVGFLTIEHGN